ncbi:type I toxin-antitoxin system SymE family toxin [Pectobacterium brasiliense]|uniref:SymE family type I addiction module toxin n=1 Tax=Pectobacterium brasiliense TaxID=180957 RepID=UPI001968E201|nr:SymE family type I addiction module toxin [Pectobacterium brasiliense]MBN3201052.1 type I toxin-antitoxin system SymE family toxin [Pectobacterium brasiliense]
MRISDDGILSLPFVQYRTSHYGTGSADPTHQSLPSAINLKGRWLEECGFITGMPVTVTVERGEIIIEMKINL